MGLGNLSGPEREGGSAAKCLPGSQQGAGETWLIGGVREMLRFEANSAALRVNGAALAPQIIHKICRIQLDSGFGRLDGHDPAAGWITQLRARAQTARRPVDHKIVVIPQPPFGLLIVRINPGPNGLR